MSSTFQGLETAKRGLYAQQQALYVTSHNIANANTKGYSRQVVNFSPTTPYPTVGINRPEIPGQIGTGVEANSIERIRDSFLDVQFRTENNKLGYWSSRADALSKMEDILNEPSNNGLAAVMGEFWQSLSDLSTYPESDGTRKVVLQRGQAVVETFHYLSQSLDTIKNDIGNEIGINLQEINSLLKQISDLNRQIGEVEPHGYLPNDLYDKRDLLVDQLSQHVEIKVKKVPPGGNPHQNAEGFYTIQMIGADGSETNLVSKFDYFQLGFKGHNGITYDVPEAIDSLTIFDSTSRVESGKVEIAARNGQMTLSSGKLKGLIESYGYGVPDGSTVSTKIAGLYPEMLDQLDQLAYTFANIFNEIHSQGFDLQGNPGSSQFFRMVDGSSVIFSNGEEPKSYQGAARDILLATLEPENIAASSVDTLDPSGVAVNGGNGRNALNLANVSGFLLTNNSQQLEGLRTIDLTKYSLISNGSINSFYESMIGQLGVDAQQANRLRDNSEVLKDSVDTNRQSVSSVSLDEEMTNVIKYQHAYNAAARQITIIDEMLDKIINGMGVSGR
ncbi:flagellar hook-associated protein FlgK [Niallia sp. Krafla_26]|uniref:flagellar hook-associated protein FlgK n=1 Tax=Niallia sp. Krafla_26 TaxID=3064703 RepID=UPI003D163407